MYPMGYGGYGYGGYGAPPPMPPPMGAPMPPMPMAGGFPAGYPVFRGTLMPNMYYKPIWTPRREMKLQRAWYEIARDGVISYNEIMRLLAVFGYHVSPYEAQWFYNTLDRNHDGRIDYVELRAAMQQFVMTYPRVRNPMKMYKVKPWYGAGYNWRMNPLFPVRFSSLWRF